MFPRLAILLPLLLAACGPDARDIRLDEIDLADTTVIERLAGELDPAEMRAFSTYVAVHGRNSAGNCGLPMIGPDGRLPETIGDAIRLVRSVSGNPS